jgi:hypothetical protein
MAGVALFRVAILVCFPTVHDQYQCDPFALDSLSLDLIRL